MKKNRLKKLPFLKIAVLRHGINKNMLLLGVFMLFGLWNFVSAQTKSVTLDVKDMPLREVFKLVKTQTGANFIYSEIEIQKASNVTLKFENLSLKTALERILKDQPYTFEIQGDIVVVKPTSQKNVNQENQKTCVIKGKVIGEDGLPIPGVNILLKGTMIGVLSDADGVFKMEVPAMDDIVVVFSFVGMKTQEITCKGGEDLEVVMKDDVTEVDEVIVTGYQDISKRKMTGAAVVISSDQLTERYNSNIVNSLEGKVAGLSTYGGELKVRGTSSLYSETSPLLVVDGLPMEGKLEDLNQFDIATVNVLKDAAATAVYGARASNGVIVVTTKNASKTGNVEIDFTANVNIFNKRNYDYNDNFYMNAEQQVAKESSYYDALYRGDNAAANANSFMQTALRGDQSVNSLEYGYYKLAVGEYSEAELSALKERLSKNNYAKDYADAIYKRLVIQEYSLAFRSRSEKNQNNLTLNYQYDNSGVINAFNRRITANYKGAFDLARWLTFSANVNAVMNKSREKGTDASSLNSDPWTRPAYESFYNEDGTVKLQYGSFEGNELYPLEEGLESLASNPVEEFYNNTVTTRRNHLLFHGELLFKVIDGLTVSAQGIYENDHATKDWMADAESHAARVIKNAYATIDDAGNVSFPVMESGGFKQLKSTDGDYWTMRGQINYTKTFGKHHVSAIAGLEFRETKTTGANTLYLGYDDQLQTATSSITNFRDLSDIFYGSYFMGGYPANQFAYGPYIMSGMDVIKESRHRFASGYANITYTYNDRYNVFASFRKDYADVYGLNAKFRGKPLVSVGAAWNMDEENFMKSVEWINFLKLRLSYGSTGNIYQGVTSVLTANTGFLNQYSKLPYASVSSPANPNLTWEKTYTTNIGVDFSFLNNRFRGAIDYYVKKSEDVFGTKSLDPTTGYYTLLVNSATMQNKGVELQATADWFRPYSRERFGWSTSLTFSHNSNEVTEVDDVSAYASSLIGTKFKKGYPSSAVWAYRFAGIDDGTYGVPGQSLWYGKDDVISHGDYSASSDVLTYCGQLDPKIVSSLDNRIEWHGFYTSMLVAYYGGHVMRALAEVEQQAGGYCTLPLYLINSWTPENPTNTPGWEQYGISYGPCTADGDIYVRKADFVKIRNIVFGYSFPKEWLAPCRITRANLQFQINNPGFIWRANKVNVDPETLGVSNPASYVFTLNVTF